MASVLQKVVSSAHQILSKYHKGDIQKHIFTLREQINELTCSDIGFDKKIFEDDIKFDPSLHQAPVTYVHLCENDVFSAGVFILRNGVRLPLHDHPNMGGILKIIHGTAAIQCYTEVIDAAIPEEVLSLVKPFQYERIKRVVASPQMIVDTSSKPCELTRTDSNLHEIRAVDGVTAFFDILFPPYDQIEGSRLCRYYKRIWPVSPEGKSNTISEQYLLEISQPRDFWCNSLLYTGPNLQFNAD